MLGLPCPGRDLALSLVIARALKPGSKLATTKCGKTRPLVPTSCRVEPRPTRSTRPWTGSLPVKRPSRHPSLGGISWITCLRAPAIRAPAEQGALQLSVYKARADVDRTITRTTEEPPARQGVLSCSPKQVRAGDDDYATVGKPPCDWHDPSAGKPSPAPPNATRTACSLPSHQSHGRAQDPPLHRLRLGRKEGTASGSGPGLDRRRQEAGVLNFARLATLRLTWGAACWEIS